MAKLFIFLAVILLAASPTHAYVSSFPVGTPTSTPTPSASPVSPGVPPGPWLAVTPTPSLSASPSVTPQPSSSALPTPKESFKPSPKPGQTPVGTTIVAGPGETIVSEASPNVSATAASPTPGRENEPSGWLELWPVVGRAASWMTGLAAALNAVLISAVAVTAIYISGAYSAMVLIATEWLPRGFGLRKKRQIWGVIYNARTKAPVPYAKVELKGADGRVLETRYADKDGRYGFLTSPASLHQESIQVSLSPSAKGYMFPSKYVTTDPDFVVYEHIYKGGLVTVSGEGLVSYNIPMDPPAGLNPVNPQPFLSGFTVVTLDVAFWIGLIAAPLTVIISPTWGNIVLMLVFFIANAIRIGNNLYRPFGITSDKATGKSLSYALITLGDKNGKRLSFTVSDERGRYFLLSETGTRIITAYTPAQVSPQRSVLKRKNTNRGWIRDELVV